MLTRLMTKRPLVFVIVLVIVLSSFYAGYLVGEFHAFAEASWWFVNFQ